MNIEKRIQELSWNETSISAKRKLFKLAWKKYKKRLSSADKFDRGNAYSALSSVSYSIVGTASKQWKKDWIRMPLWLLLGLRHFFLALRYSKMAVHYAGGIENMTPDQLDIRQSILRMNDEYEEALKCIEVALDMENVSDHTRALLLVGRAESIFRFKQGNFNIRSEEDGQKFALIGFSLNSADVLARGLYEKKEELHQVARIWRKIGFVIELFKNSDLRWKLINENYLRHVNVYYSEATQISSKLGANDQTIKNPGS